VFFETNTFELLTTETELWSYPNAKSERV